jgi:hypothetical protein
MLLFGPVRIHVYAADDPPQETDFPAVTADPAAATLTAVMLAPG